MTSRIVASAALFSLLVVPTAQADLCFESKTWQEGDNASEMASIVVEGCVDGNRFGATIVESGNPFMPEKNRLVSEDVTDVIYFVDDEDETYSPWDVNAILGAATSILRSMGPLLKIEVSNVSMTTLEQSETTFLDRDVERVKIASEYDIVARVLGLKNRQHVSAIEELWIDHDLDLGFSAWFDQNPPDLGPEFARLWELEREKLRGGVALKTVRWETSTGKKGKKVSELKTVTEITRLVEEGAPEGTYSWPDHYVMVNNMPSSDELAAGEAGAGEGEEGKKGWKNRLPFGRRGDG